MRPPAHSNIVMLGVRALVVAAATATPGAQAADLVVNGTTDTISTSENFDNAYIGQSADGGLEIVSGGNLAVTSNSYIATLAGVTGTATVTDGAAWSTFRMATGQFGTGTLVIENGADVSVGAGGLTVGTNAGSTGRIDVTGTGSTLTTTSSATIGQSGNGTLNVSDGASATFGGTFGLGSVLGSLGTATITGSGTTLTGQGYIQVGGRGTGILYVLDGADITSANATIGGNSGSTANSGTATVSGAGSTWTNAGSDFQIGFGASSGTLNIENGGTVTTASAMTLGWNNVTLPGTVNVTGAGSVLDVGGTLTIGRGGTGIMNVTDGAWVDSGTVYVGYNADSTGTLNISGATTVWDGGSTFYVGNSGTGTLNISGGTKFDAVDNYMNYLYIGANSGSQGTVNISGAGTEVVVDQYINMDGDGAATLNITGGAQVTTDYLYGGTSSDQTELLISGAGSHLLLYYGAYIGYNGDMHAVVEDGATLSVLYASLDVGQYENGELEVRSGGQVTAQSILVGGQSGSEGTFILSTGGTATTTGSFTIADGVGSAGTLIFGAAAGDAAVAAGTLNAATVAFGIGSGEIVFNHTSNLDFASALTGGIFGELTVLSGTTTFATDSPSFVGAATVTGGKAVFNADYGGTDVEVSGSGIVGGDGTIGSLNVLSGGTVAPGNSPGTIHVVEGTTFAPGSTYAVEVAGAQSDLILTGLATLNGGTVQVSGSPSLMRYAILTTSFLPIDGPGFDGVESTSAFILYSLDYDLNNVYLVIDGYNALTTAARTPNQIAVANALDKFPKDNPLYAAIIGGSIAGAQQAFNALSGEIHASVGTALADDSRYVREAITGRLIQAYYGGAGAGGGQPIVLAAAAPTDVATIDTASRMSLGSGHGGAREAPAGGHNLAYWSRAFGAWGEYNTNDNAATTDRNLGGFITGVDGSLGGGWRAGLATGYLYTGLSVDDRFSSANINSYVLGGYAGGALGHGLALRSGGTWTWNDIDSARSVIFPGFFEAESANYNGDVGQLFAELAYPLFTHGGVIEPFAGLAYVHVGTDSFTESGPVAGLTSGGLDMNLGYGTLGARAGTTVVWGGTTVIPHASLAWQYAFGDTTPQQALAFASTGIGMGIGGVPLAQNSALIEVGADALIAEDATLGLSYIGQYAGDFTDTGLRGRFNWKF